MVHEEKGFPKTKIQLIARAYENQMQHADLVSVKAQLIEAIPLIAQEYGARHDITKNVIIECVRLILNKFAHLALSEIREAYREYVVGDLKVDGAETYGGEFNVSQMGKILAAYSESRKKILGEFFRQRDLHQFNIEQANRKEKMQAAFEIEFPAMLLKKREEITDWREIPEWWYRAIITREWIHFESGEAAKIFEEAKQLAAMELDRLEEERKQESISKRIVAKLPAIGDLSSSIARKLVIFRKVILDSEWKPNIKSN